jgi:hypothetical protein
MTEKVVQSIHFLRKSDFFLRGFFNTFASKDKLGNIPQPQRLGNIPQNKEALLPVGGEANPRYAVISLFPPTSEKSSPARG